MRRAVVVLVVLGVLGLAAPATSARPPESSFTKHTDTSTDLLNGLDYWVHRPASAVGRPPLVVFLHGCSQWVVDEKGTETPDDDRIDVPVGTRWDELAEREGVVVLYPQQSRTLERNLFGCWNWFRPEHQQRGAGEPAAIAAATGAVVRSQRIDPSRVYVAGISAGADMATVLAATYPDVFAAVMPFAGCAYLTCGDVTGLGAHRAQGDRARVVPAMVVQGTADPLNNAGLGQTAVRQWIGTNDLGDDGAANGSIPAVPSREEHVDADATLLEGVGTVGDLCIRSWQYPCAGALLGLDSYPYTVHRHETSEGCSVVDAWYIHGLSHDYPGGNKQGTFTDPIGPALTEATWAFFDQHRLGAPCGRR